MSEKIKSLIKDLDNYEQDYDIKRWQLEVHTYLMHGYDNNVANTFQDLADSNNAWDDSAKQKGYLEALLKEITPSGENNTSVKPKDIDDLIRTLVNQTSKAIQPLKKRRLNSTAINFDNEYDYQDFLHSMLIPWIKDIRTEEYTPSHAGTSKRVDIFLKDHKIFIEVKYTRDKNHAKKIGDELTIDIHHYQSHPECRYLIVIIYDPNRHIVNQTGITADLSKKYSHGSNELDVKIYISN